MLRLVFLCAVLSLIKAQSTNVQQCLLNSGPLPLNAYVEGCSTPPCHVQAGSDAVIHLTFKAPHLIWNMQTKVLAQVPMIGDLPFDLGPEGVTCNFLTNSYCPVLPGEVLQHTLKLPLPALLPSITLFIEFYIVDGNDNNLMCIRVAVSV